MSSEQEASKSSGPTLAARLESATGVHAADCYQCAKCTAGCPALGDMDRSPSELMRLVQMELPQHEEKALSSLGIWMCLGCDTCATRCPKAVNLPLAMDHLRRESVENNLVNPQARDIVAFHQAFLDSIESHGRLFEVGMIVDYKLKSRRVLDDLSLGPAMLLKGKLKLLPHSVGDRKAVASIFSRVRTLEDELAKCRVNAVDKKAAEP